MTQNSLFAMLLVTVVMWITAVKELYNGKYSLGILLGSIPIIGWIAIYFGTPS